MAGNSPVYSHGCKPPLPVADGVAVKPSCRTLGRKPYFGYSSQGCRGLTLYGYARVSVREPEDKNLDLQVERLVRAGCAMGNIRAEEASGAKNDRGGLLELLPILIWPSTRLAPVLTTWKFPSLQSYLFWLNLGDEYVGYRVDQRRRFLVSRQPKHC